MIEFIDAGKKYGRRPGVVALRDVSLTVERGTVCAVVGPNGAGKSTLLGLLLGFLRPTSGSISIADEHPADYVRTHGIGYLPERFSLPPGWPVRRAMHALGGLSGLDVKQSEAALAAFGLAEHAGKTVGNLSRGLLQRLGLAQAFAAHRDLLVLDEPTEGLDPVWRVRLRDLITTKRAAGHTIVLASHDLVEVERVADRVIVLERGALREIITAQDVSARDAWRVVLDGPCTRMHEIFPDATSATGDPETTFVVHAAGTDDLNHRLAALIELGGRVVSLAPASEPLEDRVRRTMES